MAKHALSRLIGQTLEAANRSPNAKHPTRTVLAVELRTPDHIHVAARWMVRYRVPGGTEHWMDSGNFKRFVDRARRIRETTNG